MHILVFLWVNPDQSPKKEFTFTNFHISFWTNNKKKKTLIIIIIIIYKKMVKELLQKDWTNDDYFPLQGKVVRHPHSDISPCNHPPRCPDKKRKQGRKRSGYFLKFLNVHYTRKRTTEQNLSYVVLWIARKKIVTSRDFFVSGGRRGKYIERSERKSVERQFLLVKSESARSHFQKEVDI